MPHFRARLALEPLKRLAKLWPIVGVAGMRQVGKSTLLRDILGVTNFVTFDDDDAKSDAENAPKVFLAKYPRPLVMDEIQKAPKMFDALKSEVDRKRIPGNFLITGSQSFSQGEKTRESLTGRLGSLRLYPMTISEANGPKTALGLNQFVTSMTRGGLPVPMFLRDAASRKLYWDGWLDTTLLRDLPRAYGPRYDLDTAHGILREIAKILREGEYPEISLFSIPSRKVSRYLSAMESIFLVNRIPCHPSGVGRDHWIMSDSGLAAHLIGDGLSTEGATLTLARHCIYNEVAAHREYRLVKERITYFKSARGQPLDFVVDGVPIKVISKSSGPLGWEEKGLLGGIKTLKSKRGLLCAPIEKDDPIRRSGVSRVSWLHFSTPRRSPG